MLPSERLEEAMKQVEQAREDADLTGQEEERLKTAGRNIRAVSAILERDREQQEDCEVIS